MQAVILAAGKSTRTYPLTLTRPKPLLKAANKTLLEHNLDSLNGLVDEAIIVVGYKKDMIENFIKNRHKGIKIKYVEQKSQLGTAHALLIAEPCIRKRFILMAGDDIYLRNDIKKCISQRHSILTSRVNNPQNFGVIIEKNGILTDFIEKPKKFISELISTSLYSFGREIFKCIKKIKKSERNELELPDAVKLLSKSHNVRCIASKRWIPIGYPEDLLKADNILRNNINSIGKNSKIFGSVLNSSIGDGCTIMGNVKNSIVMDCAFVGENSAVEDSIIGVNSHFSGKMSGAVIADNVLAENVVVNPGCKIWPGKKILNKAITKDIK